MGLVTATSLKPESPKAIALLRVSTDAQDLARQRADLARVQRKYNLTYIRTLELHGISGTAVLDNDQIQKVLTDLSDPAVEGVACSALDRIFRPKDFSQMRILDFFATNRKNIWSAREGLLEPYTDSGWEQCMQLSTRAGAEWRELRRRSIGGKISNAELGYRNSGSCPYGYRHEHRDQRTGKRASLVIYEPEAAIVRQMFAWAIAGNGVYEIAKRLNLANVPSLRAGTISPRTGRTCSGRWDQRVVWQIVTNEIYKGSYRYPKGSPDAVIAHSPAIVDEPVWQGVQIGLAANKATRPGRSSRRYLLTGLLWCLHCGHRISSKTAYRGAAYRCSHIGNTGKRLCDLPPIEYQQLDNLIFERLWETVTEPATLYRMIESCYDKSTAAPSPKIEELKQEVARLSEIEDACYVNLKDPKLAEIRQRTMTDWQDSRKAKRAAEMELASLQQAPQAIPSRDAITALAQDLTATKPATFDDRRGFVKALVREIRLNSGEAHIDLAIPLFRDGANGGNGDGHTNGSNGHGHTNGGNGPSHTSGSSEQKGNHYSHWYIHSDQTFGSPFIRPLTLPISFSLNVKL